MEAAPRLLALQRADSPRVQFHEFAEETLANLQAFTAEVASALGLDPYSMVLEFYVIAPTSSFGELRELKIEEAADLLALQDEDVVIIRVSPVVPLSEEGLGELTGSDDTLAADVSRLMKLAYLRVDDAGHVVYCGGLEKRVTPADVRAGGRLCSAAVHTVVAAVTRLTVASGAGLLTEGPDPLLASPNWHCCETLYVCVPAPGAALQPGVWSLLASLTLRVHDGSCLPLLLAIGGPKQRTSGVWQASGPGSVGVLLTLPPVAAPLGKGAYLRGVWDSLVVAAAASAVVFVAHGAGCELALELLVDAHCGVEVQRRLRALALVEPSRPPSEFAATAAAASSSPGWFGAKRSAAAGSGGSGGGGVSAAAAASLPALLRERAFVWRCEPLVDVRLACSSDELALGIAGVLVHLNAPTFAANLGCHVQTARVAVTGFVSSQDPALRAVLRDVAGALLPSAVSHQIATFTRELVSVPSATAAGYAGGPAAAPRLPGAVPSAGSFLGVTRAIAASRGELSPPPLPIPRSGSPAGAVSMTPRGGSTAVAVATPRSLVRGVAGDGAEVSAASAQVTATPRVPAPATAQTPRVVGVTAFVPPPALSPPFDRIRDEAVAKLDLLVTDTATHWKDTGLSNGVKTYTAIVPADSELVGARGDTVLPHSLSALFQFLVRGGPSVRREMDTQLDTIFDVATPSPQHNVKRNTFKAVFPTDPRDFVLMQWYEAQADGSLRTYVTSVLDGALAPEVKGYVRGTMDIGGWVIRPISEKEFAQAQAAGLGPKGAAWSGSACRVSYLFRTSPGGKVPKMILRPIIAAQSQLPLLVHKLMLKRIAKSGPFVDAPVVNSAVGADSAAFLETAEQAQSEGAALSGLTSPREGAVAGSGDSTPAGGVASSEPVPVGALPHTGAPFDLSGTWKLDRSHSDSLQPMLAAMGVGQVWRKLMDGVDIVPTLSHTLGRLRLEDSTKYGVSVTTLELDWKQHAYRGVDQKEVEYRAIALAGVDALPKGMTPEAAVDAFRAAPPSPPPELGGAYPRFGAGSGMVLSESILPDRLGVTWDERHLVDPRTLRVVTTFVKDGAVKTRLTRFFSREGEPPPGLLQPPQMSSLQVLAPATSGTSGSRDGLLGSVVVGGGVTRQLSFVSQSSPRVGGATTAASPAMERRPDPPPSARGGDNSTTPPLSARPPEPPRTSAGVLTLSRGSSFATGVQTAAKSPAAAISTAIRLPSARPFESPRTSARGEPTPLSHSSSFRPSDPPGTSSWSASYWVPDSEAHCCAACNAPFSALLRIHHCRACGGAFCDAHSSARLPLPHLPPPTLQAARIKPDTVVRVCDSCAKPLVDSVIAGMATQGGTVSVTGGNFGTGHVDVVAVRCGGPEMLAGAAQPAASCLPTAVRVTKPHTGLSFDMPAGVGIWSCTIRVAGRTSATFDVAYARPALVSAECADTDGGLIALRGFNLGDAVALEAGLVEVALNGVSLLVERVVTPHRELQVRVPPGAGDGSCNQLSITVGGISLEQPLPYSYGRPAIYAIRCVTELVVTQSSADVAAGSEGLSSSPQPSAHVSNTLRSDKELVMVAYLTGASFGADAAAITVHVRGVKCGGAVLLLPHSKLRVVIPAAAVTGDAATAFTASDFLVAVSGLYSGSASGISYT